MALRCVYSNSKYLHSRRLHKFGCRQGHHLHDDVSEGLNLLHGAGSELCAFMRVEHDQVDLALNVLHQFHQPAGQPSDRTSNMRQRKGDTRQ